MRLINADKFKEEVAAMTICDNLPTKKANAMLNLIDMQPTAIEGDVVDYGWSYKRTASVKPSEHHYEEPGEKSYIKYSCPICEALGHLHQVIPGDKNCPLCGVNLCW